MNIVSKPYHKAALVGVHVQKAGQLLKTQNHVHAGDCGNQDSCAEGEPELDGHHVQAYCTKLLWHALLSSAPLGDVTAAGLAGDSSDRDSCAEGASELDGHHVQALP